MNKAVYFLPFFVMLLSNITKSKNENFCKQKNEIIFIFKKNDIQSSSKFRNINGNINPIYISEKGDFKRSELIINNKLKVDTIRKNLKGNIICMTYLYDAPKSYSYLFQKGDTVVFDYEKGVPRATVLGRRTKKMDCNFEANFKIQKPLDNFEFFDQNKRMRNELESKKYRTELHDYTIKVSSTLDSLFGKDLISKDILELHKERTKYYELNINKEMLPTISNDDLKRDDLLYLKVYQFFLENYVANYLKETDKKSQPNNPKKVFDYVLKSDVFSIKVKEYLLYTNLCQIIETLSNEESESYFEKFKKVVDNKELSNEIYQKYALDFFNIKKEKKGTYFINSNKHKLTLEEIFSKNVDKVIYVDFWASWCGPCRAAMPSFNHLRKKYKDRDVVFINISIDKDLTAWKMASDKEKLYSSNTNLLAMNYPNALFYDSIKLKTIPRYLLYNKKQKLVNNTAPSPDSKEIEKELDKLLNE